MQLASQRCCNMSPQFWSTWSNSPAWEVDLLKLYNRLAFHQVSMYCSLQARVVATCSSPPGATHQLGRWTFSSFTAGLLSIRLVLKLASHWCCNMFWSTWSNSPAWEVDLLELYNRLAFHQVSVAAFKPEMLQYFLVHFEHLQLLRWNFSSFTTGLLSIRLVSQLACQRCCIIFWSTWKNSLA